VAASAWLGVAAEDYELHMARIGQAEANAGLTAAWLRGLGAGAKVLFAGSGPGQMLEFIPRQALEGKKLAFCDINPEFLAIAKARLDRLGLQGEFRQDNIEDSVLAGAYENVVIALVLEHVNWREALAALERWQTQRALIIIQENPASIAGAVTPGRDVPGTMRVFRESAKPHLIPLEELREGMAARGFTLRSVQEARVLDEKKMLACDFVTSRTATAS
jgi:2-polyprenyl-3-methyl-5-hydroxy-6-metoxy-1,4-benzoquinol methylase